MRLENKFFFTRLQYESGDWDVDQRMPSNLLNSLIEYTTLPVDTRENSVSLGSEEIFRCPFCYLSGHKLVEFTAQERTNFEKYVNNGGFVFVDDCIASKWCDYERLQQIWHQMVWRGVY